MTDMSSSAHQPTPEKPSPPIKPRGCASMRPLLRIAMSLRYFPTRAVAATEWRATGEGGGHDE